MYGTLALSHRALDDLADTVDSSTIDELRALARPIEGLRVLKRLRGSVRDRADLEALEGEA